jgi:hypothetical protein
MHCPKLVKTIFLFRIVFWDVLPCKIFVDRRLRGTCYLLHQGWARNLLPCNQVDVDRRFRGAYFLHHERVNIYTEHSLHTRPWELEISQFFCSLQVSFLTGRYAFGVQNPCQWQLWARRLQPSAIWRRVVPLKLTDASEVRTESIIRALVSKSVRTFEISVCVNETTLTMSQNLRIWNLTQLLVSFDFCIIVKWSSNTSCVIIVLLICWD